jgi:hypothetical protein
MTIPAWQLAIRFALEVGSLVAIGRFAASFFRGGWSYAAALGAPAFVALLWVTFAVKGDPSRSGHAPIPIPGALRLALEMAVFLGGAAALAARQSWVAFALFVLAFVVHHAMTTERLAWLLRQ